MTPSQLPRWLRGAPRCAALDIRAAFRVLDSVYVGPASNFTPEEWSTRRVSLPIEGLPLIEGKLLPASREVPLDRVVAYYAALLGAADSHGRALDASSIELSLKPWITADGSPLCRFPWLDTYRETKAVLTSLAAAPEGVIVDQVDQHWAVIIARAGESVLIGERAGKGGGPARKAEAPAGVVSALAKRASDDLEAFIDGVESALKRRIWRG